MSIPGLVGWMKDGKVMSAEDMAKLDDYLREKFPKRQSSEEAGTDGG